MTAEDSPPLKRWPSDAPFAEFFKRATRSGSGEGFDPYPYQVELASGDIPDILKIPTGAGKTEAVVLAAWLWRRRSHSDQVRDAAPRRLVYCLPMRALVDQTASRVRRWIANLGWDYHPGGVRVVVLKGDDMDRQHVLHPEEDMIIVGTQDMLLSRALNRAYGATPFAWQQEFGAINNDCMWVMDEVQIMHNGLATSVQLDAYRKDAGTIGPHKTVWMSATVDAEWIRTAAGAAGAPAAPPSVRELSARDRDSEELQRRNAAKKILKIMLEKADSDKYTDKEAKTVLSAHVTGSLTLVVVNTVGRARSLHGLLGGLLDDLRAKKHPAPRLLLVHSRFRRDDRVRINKELERLAEQGEYNPDDGAGTIVVATQVVEAGIDISARTLVTEIAPRASLIQRFGRCNRRGEYGSSAGAPSRPPATADQGRTPQDPVIHVIKLKPNAYAPYDDAGMEDALAAAEEWNGRSMSPGSIPPYESDIDHDMIIRRSTILSLFDTTPELMGSYSDISRYVRSADGSTDVYVFWRDWDRNNPVPKLKRRSGEMCSVPIGDMRGIGAKHTYVYDVMYGAWSRISPSDIRPGQTILIHCEGGGYTADGGWDPSSKERVDEAGGTDEAGLPVGDSSGAQADGESDEEAMHLDQESVSSGYISLYRHTCDVQGVLDRILARLDSRTGEKLSALLREAVTFHDIGKAHPKFQDQAEPQPEKSEAGEVWAKFPCKDDSRGKEGGAATNGGGERPDKDSATKQRAPRFRPLFRHEVASAMAVLAIGTDTDAATRLVAYLVAQHHGKVGMAMQHVRAGLRQTRARRHDQDDILGVSATSEEHLRIPEAMRSMIAGTSIAPRGGIKWDELDGSSGVRITADVARLGTPDGKRKSWLQIVHELLDEYGPFRLAYLVAIIKAADQRASAEEKRQISAKEGDTSG